MSALEWDAIGLASLEHRASGVASVGSSHLRTVVTQAVDYNEHSLSFSLVTPQGTYTYAGSGMMQGMSNEAWGGLTYRYEGTYEVMGRPTLSERVPEAGSYLVAITVSRSSDRVVSVSVTLMEEPGA
jgi:hypothetical protein